MPPAEDLSNRDLLIRDARKEDAEAMLEIYRPIVRETAISFEITVPTVEDFTSRIHSLTKNHVWLVAMHGGHLVGYAYATPLRSREAYAYSVETSVYVHESQRGNGLGRLLYQRLFDHLVLRGYFHAYAAITLPNPASVALHRSAGFSEIGVFPAVGFKFGRWQDVSWWHRTLQRGTPKL